MEALIALVGIVDPGAVVHAMGDLVLILIGLAQVSDAVEVAVLLLGVEEPDAVVFPVLMAVSVEVILTGVSHPVSMGVELLRIEHEPAYDESCWPNQSPYTEICGDQVDNNCDGEEDEGC